MENELSKKLEKYRLDIDAFLSDKAMRIIQVEGTNHFNSSFINEGFTNRSLVKWKERKKPKGLKGRALEAWEKKNAGRAILVSHSADTKGGHLKDSISSEISGDSVIFSSDKPYAAVHNEGLLSGRGSGFTMPQRQFIGPSEVLENQIIDKLTKEIINIFNF